MELFTWLIRSEIALSIAAVAALAMTGVAILRDVTGRVIASVPAIGPG